MPSSSLIFRLGPGTSIFCFPISIQQLIRLINEAKYITEKNNVAKNLGCIAAERVQQKHPYCVRRALHRLYSTTLLSA